MSFRATRQFRAQRCDPAPIPGFLGQRTTLCWLRRQSGATHTMLLTHPSWPAALGACSGGFAFSGEAGAVADAAPKPGAVADPAILEYLANWPVDRMELATRVNEASQQRVLPRSYHHLCGSNCPARWRLIIA